MNSQMKTENGKPETLNKHILRYLKKWLLEMLQSRFSNNEWERGKPAKLSETTDELKTACKGIEPEFLHIGQELQTAYGDTTKLTRRIREQEIPAKLSKTANDLKTACKEIEPEFLHIGQELQTVYGDTTKLTRQVQDSANLIGGKEGSGVLFQMRRLAEDSLARLEDCRKNISEKTGQEKTVQEQLDALSTIFHEVKKTGQLFRVVAVNTGIECTRSNESAKLFSAVASDIAKLSKKIMTTSKDGLDVLKEARDTEQTLYGDLSKGLKEITGMGKNVSGIVRNAIQEIENLITSMLQLTEQAGEHTRQVSQQVGKLVVAVQFHDSMSQRVEHIADALGDVEAYLIEDAADKLPLALSIIKLQTAQLKEIIDEIGHVYKGGGHSFEEIIRELRTLLNHLLGCNVSTDQDAGRGRAIDSFDRLRSSFSELDGLLRRSQALMDPVRHAASRASDTVVQVTGLVQDIHTIVFKSHLVALNAIINAAHLGSGGRTLEVLAQEVKHSSNQSMSIVERADALLDLVTDAANKLRDQNTATETDISLEDSIPEMIRTYNRFMEESTTTHKRADKIKDAVSVAKGDLDFLPRLVEKLTGSLDRLEAMVRELTSFVPAGHHLGQDTVDNILKRYTMDKEREIHQTAFSGSTDEVQQGTVSESLPEPHDPGGRAKKAIYEEEKAENIELFMDEEEAEDKDNANLFTDDPVREADKQWNNVELFDSDAGTGDNQGSRNQESEAEIEAEETSENEGDLGNNVELF
jgi:methyl-accepting chemotaxis protein